MNEIDRAHLRNLRSLPVEGLPPVEARPKCLGCRKRLEPQIRNHWSKLDGHDFPKVERRTFEGYKGYGRLDQIDGGMFCTMRCAYRFARAAVRAGFRLKAG
jgi:hypothetical protein